MFRIVFTLIFLMSSMALALAQWTAKDLSLPRRDIGIAAANGKIFFAGGVPANSVGDLATYRKRVDIYDIASGAWTQENLQVERQYTFAVGVGSKLYFAGYTQTSAPDQDVVEVYDVQTGNWSTITMPNNFGATSVAAEQGRIFFVDGGTVDIYNTGTGTWTSKSLSVDRILAYAIGCNGKVFFAGGGFSAGTIYKLVDIYNISSNSWSTANLSEGRNQILGACLNNKVYFVGGSLGFSGYSQNIDIYDTQSGGWTLKQLNAQKSVFAVAATENNLYIAGGYDNDDFNYLTEVEIINGATGTKTTSDLPVARGGVRGLGVGDMAFFAGGNSSNSVFYTTVDIYDEMPSGVFDREDARFSIFPNPVEDQLFIVHKEETNKPLTYNLYNVFGQLVGQGQCRDQIDISNFQPGLYVLELEGGMGGKIKFIKS